MAERFNPNKIPPLTQRQFEILSFIDNFNKENGFSPSVRAISENMGFSSTKSARDFRDALEKKGYIKYSYDKTAPKHLSMKIIVQIPPESATIYKLNKRDKK